MRIAYFCEPQVGGTFTFFLRLRAGLASAGVEARCIPPITADRFRGTRFEALEGVDYLALPDDLGAATGVLARHVVEQAFDVAVVLPGCDVLTTSLPAYLPASVRTVARVPMATQGAYRPVVATQSHLDRIIAVCDLIRDDLLNRYGVAADRVAVVPNGTDPDLFSPPADRPAGGPLRLLYVGRLEDVQKNVLLLPGLLQRLRGAGHAVSLTVAGSGPDRERLSSALDPFRAEMSIDLRAAQSHAALVDLYRAADVFVFPTRFEGSPNALLEAMSCGCVPVASRLPGCIDTVVEDGISGFLCRVGDAGDLAERIGRLAADAGLRARMAAAARKRIVDAFTVERMIAGYRHVLDEVRGRPSARREPLDLSTYRSLYARRAGWRGWIPDAAKKPLRTLMARWGRPA